MLGVEINNRLIFHSHIDRVFPRPFTHGGGGGEVQWDKTLMGGGTHEGGHRPYGGDLTLIEYIINKSTVIVELQLHDAI